jgi:L-asparaginase/Glu-tRNA(Gln) amidotransferase subunit D
MFKFIYIILIVLISSCSSKKLISVSSTDEPSSQDLSKNEIKPLNESNVLILLDGKEITKEETKNLDTNNIDSIEVIKNKESIKIYTDKAYDGIIIIHLKKN